MRRRHRCQSATRRSTSEALVPPKPKEFDSATSMRFSRFSCGTRSILVSTDGLSRFSVGGATLSRIASAEKIASTEPAARAVAVGGRSRDVIGVARHAVANDLGVDLRAARLGVLVFFQNDHTGALAHDEAVTVAVVRP